jgi:splicing factor 3A subunit 3
VKIYEDEDGARKEEIAALANKENPFQAFYDRLKDVREYHRRFPNMDVTEVLSGGSGRHVEFIPC